MKKTKIYYTFNGFKKYLEVNKTIIGSGNISLYYQLIENDKYKLCKDDGPTVEYWNGINIYKSSKMKYGKFYFDCIDSYRDCGIGEFVLDTNHILCNLCNKFCKQKCFA